MSRREAARRFGIDPRTVAKMLAFSVPPGYRRSRPPARPKLDPFVGIIDRILEEDKGQPAKQQHTSKRIFERLRDEHGYTGGITIVEDYVYERRQRIAHSVFIGYAYTGCGFAAKGRLHKCVHHRPGCLRRSLVSGVPKGVIFYATKADLSQHVRNRLRVRPPEVGRVVV